MLKAKKFYRAIGLVVFKTSHLTSHLRPHILFPAAHIKMEKMKEHNTGKEETPV